MNGIKVRFWGTRGSVPTALTANEMLEKLARALLAASGKNFDTIEKARDFAQRLPFAVGGTFGGNSSCVELISDGTPKVLLDMGSGGRHAGIDALRQLAGKPGEFHIFMSHLHWDHIMGFPFFTPAYLSGQHIYIRMSCGNRTGIPTSAVGALLSGGPVQDGRAHRVCTS